MATQPIDMKMDALYEFIFDKNRVSYEFSIHSRVLYVLNVLNMPLFQFQVSFEKKYETKIVVLVWLSYNVIVDKN